MTTFNLPDLGEGLQEAEIVTWHVGIGDHVVADQPLLSVETEKAVVEIPSPQSGRIAKLFGEAGEIVKIGAALVEFEAAGQADAGTVVGKVPEAKPAATEAATETELPPAPEPKAGAGRGPKATPAVRALARKLNVNLAVVGATGPGDTTTKADVERAAAALEAAGPLEPLRGVRRAMARNMARSHAEVVPATVTDAADIGDWPKGADVTMRLIRAIVAGCAAEPALNAWYLGLDEGRRLHDKVHLSIAMDTGDGLFVPVLRDVGNRDEADLRSGLEAMKADVRARTVPLEELRGGTITLSNFGMFGGQHAALAVLPPQVAILGAGRVHDRVVPLDGAPAIRRALPISLTFDHRAVMGGEASRFLAALVADLETAE
ncbi:MAG: 2-oxo acid dehydrogenase subunit E2 [Rhodospirillales bacterium]|nr:2-oxo acid dehydrogenase subunit E2 [Rhodospirillales bacterium]MDH3913830.1 2-oxo acid dehydrogenase subunit E2 [Rhodospirillales bacterium]MDH3920054.1 2-oxo acid dehydrogenase subunit E2 [Rhodospirillales bacterium]MDH3969892.1 2-oxo acid dehydrogenase subunit E2 [Rhodospirillales bacterium]